MRRVRYDAPGGPLFLERAPVPEPAPGELLVRCEAVGVTLPVVRKVTEAADPVALGGEIAGEVVAVGADVTRFRVGDRVTGLCIGYAYADFACLGEAMASPVPEGASPVDAVALVRSGLVALGALEAARPQPGEAALVTAAAGACCESPVVRPEGGPGGVRCVLSAGRAEGPVDGPDVLGLSSGAASGGTSHAFWAVGERAGRRQAGGTSRPKAGGGTFATRPSGVGRPAVRLARLRGAGRLVGAVSDRAKSGFVRSLGADEVVVHGDDWGRPVDYVLDAVGSDLLPAALAALAPGGRPCGTGAARCGTAPRKGRGAVSMCGSAAGLDQPPPARGERPAYPAERLVAYGSGGGTVRAYDLLVGAKTVTGFQVARIAREQPELYGSWRRELWRLFAAGSLRPAVHGEFALEEAVRAHAVIEARSNLGKVVLRP
ncbi:zinc-binding dehydrogenase [Streptomyces sp. GESEQ-35]|uniref:quinone oxidoreductase family protein n=1 Tax=Streptomyces sp. GESEQ-35 TaxID=2812657 RepID=UPI001B330203|nr:zinc-binding dehydrogenase [Streptomyces sp. GESEQ-35]